MFLCFITSCENFSPHLWPLNKVKTSGCPPSCFYQKGTLATLSLQTLNLHLLE